MESAHPKISVCIPTHNHGRFLTAAIESVLSQTCQDFEAVVCDDASTDGTPDVMRQVRDPRVRYFRNTRRCGVSGNRNHCLTAARGRYIAWLDADDLYMPEMLERQSAFLDNHPSVGMVHGWFHVMDVDGRRMKDWPAVFPVDVVENGCDALAELVLSNYVNNDTVMVRRQCYCELGGYAHAIRGSGEDWEMWLRIALHWDLGYTAHPLACYRQHPASTSHAARVRGKQFYYDRAVVRQVERRLLNRADDPARLKRRAKAALAIKGLTLAGDLLTERRHFAAAKAALHAMRLAGSAVSAREKLQVLRAIAGRCEYACHCRITAMCYRLAVQLADSRFGRNLLRSERATASWEQTLGRIAMTVQRLVPERSTIAAVDKWDPTLLHLSGRKGFHFPDRRLMPEGYPRTGAAAIEHLERLRNRKTRYLVVPSAAFWWLDYYTDFRRHLDDHYHQVWKDEDCILYDLSLRGASMLQAT